VAKAGELAQTAIRNARAKTQKLMRQLELARKLDRVHQPDLFHKAHKKMEAKVEAGLKQVKDIVQAAQKGMEK
jgi:hypothetical protein